MATKKSSKPKHAGGRPTDFRPEFVEQVEKLTLIGAVDEQLADFFHVSTQTIFNWKKKYPEFLDALKRGKEKIDNSVERALLHRALGYKHIAFKFFQHGGKVITKRYVEHYPPDAACCFGWLNNRRPDQWRQRRDDVPPDDGETIVPVSVTVEFKDARRAPPVEGS